MEITISDETYRELSNLADWEKRPIQDVLIDAVRMYRWEKMVSGIAAASHWARIPCRAIPSTGIFRKFLHNLLVVWRKEHQMPPTTPRFEFPNLTGDKRVDFAIWDLVQVLFEIAQTTSARAKQETDHQRADATYADGRSY
ncbi:MAG: hypothetical protein M1305_06220 [Candidatus Marsarchaeota archaeon]|nr:hypothetical protein [Candidatus Marsarchaeota archaeon]